MSSLFSDFLHDTQAGDVPDEVLGLGRRWLLDLIGIAAGGTSTRLSGIICNHVADHFAAGRRRSRILFDGRAASPVGAALAGGMTIDSLDGHDGHKLAKGHVGCGVLPALLAVSEAEGKADDRAFLTALVIGYELGTRAGIALHRTTPDYHTSGAWIAIAAAALSARVLGLDHARTRETIGIAEYHGPRSQMMRCIDFPTMVKDGSGWGAMTGVSAAYLAADGFTGAPAISVEGEDVTDLWSDLGANWRIAEQYFKPYPVCRWAQPPLQAVLNLRAAHGIASEDVERIEITTFHQSKRLATRYPQTTEEAQYSTAYPTAVALVRGGVTPDDVMEESLGDPEIRRLAASMVVTESDEYNAAFPARRFADVKLVLRNGKVFDSGRTEAIGDPEAPMPMDRVRAKFHAYATPKLGTDRCRTIEAAVDRLGDGSSATVLFDLVLSRKSELEEVAT